MIAGKEKNRKGGMPSNNLMERPSLIFGLKVCSSIRANFKEVGLILLKKKRLRYFFVEDGLVSNHSGVMRKDNRLIFPLINVVYLSAN
jgi:hypothetical protein